MIGPHNGHITTVYRKERGQDEPHKNCSSSRRTPRSQELLVTAAKGTTERVLFRTGAYALFDGYAAPQTVREQSSTPHH